MAMLHGLFRSALRAALAPMVFLLSLPCFSQLYRADLDADFNGDGVIGNAMDSPDTDFIQHVPPGLRVKVGKLEELVLRLNSLYPEEGVVELTVVSQPDAATYVGNTADIPAMKPGGGGIRVWDSATKMSLVLDSHDGTLQSASWVLAPGRGIGNIPDRLYAEGTKESLAPGDLCLLLRYWKGKRVIAQDEIVVTVGNP